MNINSIPQQAVPYILYQRTSYLTLTHTLAYRALNRLMPFSLYKPAVQLESALRGKRIKQMYLADMEKEYNSIRQHLPESCQSVLDIGCGLAGINIFLSQHYNAQNVDFYLLDKSKMEDEIYYLYKESGAFYNSLGMAEEILLNNNIPKDKIHLIEATENNDINTSATFDLVISLISWGFHYPVSVYLDKAYDKLNPGGTLIIDVRKDTSGLEDLEQKFGAVNKIEETRTKYRVVAKKI